MQLTLPFAETTTSAVLTEDDEIASIEPSLGAVYANVHQAAVISHITGLLMRALGQTAVVRIRTPVDLGAVIVPDPSLVVCAHRRDGYIASHPTPEDVSLIIEVLGDLDSGDHVRFDVYRDYGIQNVWAVDVENGLIMAQDNRLNVNAIYQDSEKLTIPGTSISFSVSNLLSV